MHRRTFCSTIRVVQAKALDEPTFSKSVMNPLWAAFVFLWQGGGLRLKRPKIGVVVASLLSTIKHGCFQFIPVWKRLS